MDMDIKLIKPKDAAENFNVQRKNTGSLEKRGERS